MTFYKCDIVAMIAAKVGLNEKDTARAINSIMLTIGESIERDDSVVIPEFGTFIPLVRADHPYKHPNTGERCVIPSHKMIKFVPSDRLVSVINGR